MHIASFAANECLIDLNFTAKCTGHILMHGLANAVHHKPRRFLGNADGPGYLAGANSVLAIADHPERTHPFIESKRTIFKYRPNLQRELLLASRAKPDAASLDKGVLLGATARARDNSIGPAKVKRVPKAAVWVTEVNDRFLKRAGNVHGLEVRRHALCVKYIITQISARRMQLLGTRGRIELAMPFTPPPDRASCILIDDGRDLAGSGICTETFPPCNQFTILGEAFSRAVREGGSVPVPLTDALKNMAVIEAIVHSGRSGGWEAP
jgi:hypothetical protein